MGIDTQIFFTLDNPINLKSLHLKHEIEFVMEGYHPEGATHEINPCLRYYDVGYEQGPWPDICHILLTLYSNIHVSTVWHGPDTIMDEKLTPICGRHRILEITEHYMIFGNRPYIQEMSE